MFDSSVALADLDAVQLAAAVTDNQAVLRRAECRVLELACAWSLSSRLCKWLLILLVWVRGSSTLYGVPVLAAVKRGRLVRLAGRVDRGCAPAESA